MADDAIDVAESEFFSPAQVETPGPLSVSLSDWISTPPAAIEWLVEGVLPVRGFGVLFGKPKSMKTLIAFLLGLCAASGDPDVNWIGFPCRTGNRVLYIDEETGPDLLYARYLRQRTAHRAFSEPELIERFRVATFKGFRVDRPDDLRREIDLVRPDLVIFDSFRRIFSGDENDSAAVSKAMRVFTSLREEFGIAELLIHHSRKNPDGESWEDSARGSGDIFASADSLIGLSKKGPGVIAIRAVARAAREIEPVSASLDEETLTLQRSTDTPAESFDPEEAIAEILTKQADRRARQKTVQSLLESGYGCSRSQTTKLLAKIPLVDLAAPPDDIRVGKVTVPGTTNEKELVLIR